MFLKCFFHDRLTIIGIPPGLCSACPISLNVYEMKLNEGHFSCGTVIIHF